MSESRIAPRLLAGLQAGIVAGLAITCWFVALSYLYFREPWALTNVMAASLRQNATWGHTFSMVTWTGIAANLAACGGLGMLMGWILPRPGPRARSSLAGLTLGIVLSLLVYQFFWLRFVPLLGEYVAPVGIWIAHMLFGMSVAQIPHFYLGLAAPDMSIPKEPVISDLIIPNSDGEVPAAPKEDTPNPEIVIPPHLETPRTHTESPPAPPEVPPTPPTNE